ncbi:MAG: glycogen debranching protein GlgX, partial [Verrucomicrobium sp.]
MKGLFSKLSTLGLGEDALQTARQLAVPQTKPLHLGATPVVGGVHFNVYSRTADGVDLCLYDLADPAEESARVRMVRDDDDVWHAFVPDLKAGALYGFRARGAWNPAQGRWFNSHKLLLDPYAKAILGVPDWREAYQNIEETEKAGRDFQDSGPVALKSVVITDEFDWQGDALLDTPWTDTVIYEMHVKGFTMQHPDVPKEIRGTYAGLADPAAIAYLKAIGVTAVQLIPVHQHLDDGFLLAKGLTNYWGYNTIGFFAPHSEYALARDPQAQVDEFKTMVRELHKAGLEVILDVVYNHTAEGDENGPLIFLRGLDNPGYYLLNNEAKVLNYTGCGNTVNAATPPALRLIMDSLRYWVEEMHVDGFRFDLGATLGRRGELFDIGCSFFQAVAQDPVLRRVKMIAEPWDMGPNGYQVGGFPKPWHELNGRYRDNVRCYWKGDAGLAADFAKRLCGSQDIFGPGGRHPGASVNFLTSHDGFTLR